MVVKGLITVLLTSLIASSNSNIELMLIGSLWGDALGGPIEFRKSNNNLRLQKYSRSKSPYGPWKDFANPGTITDDSRHKIIFFNALKNYKKISRSSLASSYEDFHDKNDNYRDLRKKWLSEYVKAARWVNGQREPSIAKPPQTLFNSETNVSGQLLLMPLAGFYINKPKEAYLKCMEINWIDTGDAADFNCMIIASLSNTLGDNKSFSDFINTILMIDPFKLRKAPFVKRKINEVTEEILTLNKRKISNDSKFKKRLIEILKPKYWWEDHVAYGIVIAYFLRNKNNYKKAIQEIINFKQDSDTYLQLAGAILGALGVNELFHKDDLELIKFQLKEDYSIDFNMWLSFYSRKSYL